MKRTILSGLAFLLIAGLPVIAATAEPRFETVVIDRGNVEGVSVVDVNNDGLLDIVAVPSWYRAPFWDKRPVTDAKPLQRGEFLNNYGQVAIDMNGDGATDIVTAGWFDKQIFWYENPSKQRNWRRLGDEYVEWTQHVFATPPQLGGGCESIMALDIDGDGQTDALPNQRPLGWYRIEKDAQGKPAAVRYPIDESGHKEADWQHGMGFGDINGDGRKDVVTNDAWWEAPKDPKKEKWIAHRDFKLHDASVPMLVVDVDGDGDNDILHGHGHNKGVFFQENTGKEGKARWVQHTIDDTWTQAHSAAWVDIDADQKPELVVGKRWRGHGDDDPGSFEPLGIYYYEYDPAKKNWEKHTITHDEHIGVGMQLTVVDIDKDGDLDIVVPGKSGVYLLRNKAIVSSEKPSEELYRPKPGK